MLYTKARCLELLDKNGPRVAKSKSKRKRKKMLLALPGSETLDVGGWQVVVTDGHAVLPEGMTFNGLGVQRTGQLRF